MRRSGFTVLVLAVATTALPALACVTPKDGLKTSRIIQIDASNGAIYGQITRFTREPDFLKPKEVVLTFDDGPSPRITRSILDTLEKFCVKATFFPVGRMAIANPRLMREIAAKGHTIGAHTWTHPNNMRRLTKKGIERQIEKGFAAVARAADVPIAPFFRFPGLNDDARALAYLQARGVATFTVDVVSDDSYIPDPAKLARITLSRIRAQKGGIALFHDIKSSTADALPRILSELRSDGFSIVHLKPKFAFTPLDRYSKEFDERLVKTKKPRPTVSLAGLRRTVRPRQQDISVEPPVTHLAPARRKIELSAQRDQRLRALTQTITGRRWATIIDDGEHAPETSAQ